MSKSLLGGGTASAVAILSASLIFYAQTSVAEPLASAANSQETQQKNDAVKATDAQEQQPRVVVATALDETNAEPAFTTESPKSPATKSNGLELIASSDSASGATQPFVATAYSLRGRTASGRMVERGLIAADRRVLPLGTRVRLEAGPYSGEYLVADTGGLVRGRKIDIWMPNTGEAMRFGRRTVKLTVLSYGGRRAPVKPAIRVR